MEKGMRAAGMMKSQPKTGGGGMKSAPWWGKMSASEKRKEAALKRQLAQQSLSAFRALGPRAALPKSRLYQQELQVIVKVQCTLEVPTHSHSNTGLSNPT